jgi:predicted transcriptional regulator
MLRKISIPQRRSNLEIVAEILKIARKGARKTRIVYGANLNFKMLGEYLERLEKAGLIAQSQENSGLVKTTDKGYQYLQQFGDLKDFGID